MRKTIGFLSPLAAILLLPLAFSALAGNAAADPGEAVIVDHTCTDLAAIPDAFIEQAKARFRIAYGHTSHGSQIVTGMEVLRARSVLYAFSREGGEGTLSLHDKPPYGDLGDPLWVQKTRDILEASDNERNLIMWSWCGQVSNASEAYIDDYLAKMSGLEAEFPGVVFVYMTGHLNGTGESGNLHARNNQIRRYCRERNKILFDFADIESYDPDGNYFLDKGANDACAYTENRVQKNWAQEWCSANPGACQECDCAHSQCLNCQLKGKAFWWMMARLAGWNPQMTPAAPTVDVSTSGTHLSLQWTAVEGADGYTLFYAPYPEVSYIASGDLGNVLGVSGDLWQGAAFYVALRAYNAFGSGDFSNIEHFVMP